MVDGTPDFIQEILDLLPVGPDWEKSIDGLAPYPFEAVAQRRKLTNPEVIGYAPMTLLELCDAVDTYRLAHSRKESGEKDVNLNDPYIAMLVKVDEIRLRMDVEARNG
jgi:hypothetical protein